MSHNAPLNDVHTQSSSFWRMERERFALPSWKCCLFTVAYLYKGCFFIVNGLSELRFSTFFFLKPRDAVTHKETAEFLMDKFRARWICAGLGSQTSLVIITDYLNFTGCTNHMQTRDLAARFTGSRLKTCTLRTRRCNYRFCVTY